MDYKQVHNNKDILLLQCISGSRAYGLETPESDTDVKGVYLLPKQEFYGLDYIPQVSSDRNDIVYYELKRFIELLSKNNPNILELLSTPDDCILHRHPIMDMVKPEMFLSKLCYDTFAGYAKSQIKKAQGLNKKIFNPIAKEKKDVGDFCYVLTNEGTLPLKKWLEIEELDITKCGLAKLDHAKDMYALYFSSDSHVVMRGIYSNNANEVMTSIVPEQLKPLAFMSFNKEGYSSYCKDYHEYWNWVNNRNDSRYEKTLEHGKNYDAKNMMHTFRLLLMSYDIANEGRVKVRRNDRSFLLDIKSGKYMYEELISKSYELFAKVEKAYKDCNLPPTPDIKGAEKLLVEMRYELYKK